MVRRLWVIKEVERDWNVDRLVLFSRGNRVIVHVRCTAGGTASNLNRGDEREGEIFHS